MEIVGEDYKITPINDHAYFFDLELLKEIKGKTGIRKEFTNAGYGMTLESCVKKIIMSRLSNKFETLELKQFLKEYKNLQDELINTIHRGTK